MSEIWKDMVQTRASIEREHVDLICSFISTPSVDDREHMALLHVLDRYHLYNYADDWSGFALWFIDSLNAAEEEDVTLKFLDATNAIRREVFK